LRKRFVRRLNAGLHADDIGDFPLQTRIQLDEEIDDAARRAVDRPHEGVERFAGRFDFEAGREFERQLGTIGEGKRFGVGLNEKVERVIDRHLRAQIDFDP